jgi:cell division protease FtsH
MAADSADEERYNFKESYLRDKIAVMFGGRLAEAIVFGQVSSGAENDLRQATVLARRMVAHLGMSRRLGPVSFPQGQQHVLLGREIAQEREHSEATATLIDQEIGQLLRDIESHACKIFEQHREMLDTLARTLEERETLDVEDLKALLGSANKAAR